MPLTFWAKTSGTWINAATVFMGTYLGLLLQGRLPLPMITILTQGVGLITLAIGFSMATSLGKVKIGSMDGIILALFAIVLGGILGEWLKIENRLTQLGNWLKARLHGRGRFTEGFVAASLLFCVGPLTLLGSFNNGLTGNNTLLSLKATMDGIAAIALTSSFGIGVGFSVIVILLYQGGLSLLAAELAQTLPHPSTSPSVLLLTGVGGLMILGIGLNLLEIAQIRVASFLPALFLAPVAYEIVVKGIVYFSILCQRTTPSICL
ncbi:MAG: DUF554 domain-containing protein [Scytolyngbya sp. HA4215-MV1]|nr:DUF554 domain-containing protein [Scytolyngbya sp. HA4215-MV1]